MVCPSLCSFYSSGSSMYASIHCTAKGINLLFGIFLSVDFSGCAQPVTVDLIHLLSES